MNLLHRRLLLILPLLALLTGCAVPWAAPQAAPRVYRIGYLGNAPGPLVDVYVDELNGLGYVVGQNLTMEYRWAEGRPERFPQMARELAGLKLDAIFTSTELGAQQLLEADADAPIVVST